LVLPKLQKAPEQHRAFHHRQGWQADSKAQTPNPTQFLTPKLS
jgi:hypothetical protein